MEGTRGSKPGLAAVLFADRTTVKPTTGMSPYRILFGQEAVLPIELEVPTWATLSWEKVDNTLDLLALRARQIERRDSDMEEAMLRLQRMRFNNKEYFDSIHRVLQESLSPDDMVLLHNTIKEADLSRNNTLRFRWLGPYRIHEARNNGSYLIKELDGTVCTESVAGNRLKRFFARGGQDYSESPAQSTSSDEDEPAIEHNNNERQIPPGETQQEPLEYNPVDLIPDEWDLAVVIPPGPNQS